MTMQELNSNAFIRQFYLDMTLGSDSHFNFSIKKGPFPIGNG